MTIEHCTLNYAKQDTIVGISECYTRSNLTLHPSPCDLQRTVKRKE